MLKCRKCGNTESFTAEGKFSYNIEDELDGQGNITEVGTQQHEGWTEYSRIVCCECDAETEDIEGAEEWIKSHR